MRDSGSGWLIISAGVFAGLACLLVAVAPAACGQSLPEPTETVIATVDAATWAKVMDRREYHLPTYTVHIFNAPAPGETVFWGVERYDEKNLSRGLLRYLLPDYVSTRDWQCFANGKPASMQERDGLRYILLDGKEYGPFGAPTVPYTPSQQPACQVVEREGKFYLLSSDKEYGPFDELGKFADSGRCNIVWLQRDGRWHAWALRRKGARSREVLSELSFAFSPDGRRFAFTARGPAGWYLNVDGQEFGPYELPRDHSQFGFSPDSAHYALTARRSRQWWLLADGKEIGPFEAEPWWDFAGGDVWYLVKQRGAFRIVLGDKEWGPFEKAEASVFVSGEGGPRPAFRAKRGGAWYARWADRELGPFEAIHSCGVSPDGRRMIAFAAREGKWYAIMEGAEYGPYDRLEQDSMGVFFSRQGEHVAFPAWRGGEWLLVVDGKEYPSGFRARELPAYAISFSPDGQRTVLALQIGSTPRPPSDQLLLVTAPGGRSEPLYFRQEGGRDFPSALPDWWYQRGRFPVWNPKSGKLMGIVRSSQTTDNFWTEGYLGKAYQEIYTESLRLDGPDAVTFVAGNEGKLLFVRQPLK